MDNSANIDRLNREINTYRADLTTHLEKVKRKQEPAMDLYVAYLELGIKVAQRELARLK